MSERVTARPKSRIVAGRHETVSPLLVEQPAERWQLSLGRLPNHPNRGRVQACPVLQLQLHPARFGPALDLRDAQRTLHLPLDPGHPQRCLQRWSAVAKPQTIAEDSAG